MTLCHFHLDVSTIPVEPPREELHVHLYGAKAPKRGSAAIGNQVRDLCLRFGVQPSTRAIDLVSIALAVTAADTFVLRDGTDTGWSRELYIRLPLCRPEQWNAVRTQLASTLGFLSGDTWTFEFLSGGECPPAKAAIQRHQSCVDPSRGDFVSLFSGGLDSTIYALLALKAGERPILVSHGYMGDKEVQNGIVNQLPVQLEHASVNAWPNSDRPSDITMRTRSFLFLAIAALVCDLKSRLVGKPISLRVPENGLIAINAPLTPRSIGSNSTRTTHPHYLAGIQTIFDAVGIPATLNNPFELMTKGEMVALVSDDVLFQRIASNTVSCGKWKRAGKQCGRCVPCLIRRASLYAGNVDDETQYQSPDLAAVMKNGDHRDDLVAVLTAVTRLKTRKLDQWVAQSGPLPADQTRRRELVEVHRRGLSEVGQYLADSGFT